MDDNQLELKQIMDINQSIFYFFFNEKLTTKIHCAKVVSALKCLQFFVYDLELDPEK